MVSGCIRSTLIALHLHDNNESSPIPSYQNISIMPPNRNISKPWWDVLEWIGSIVIFRGPVLGYSTERMGAGPNGHGSNSPLVMGQDWSTNEATILGLYEHN